MDSRRRISSTAACTIANGLADTLRRERQALAREWASAIGERDASAPPPSAEILAAFPQLIDGIAWYIEHAGESLNADTPAVRTAIELGKLRYKQGADARDILEEYVLLAEVLFKQVALEMVAHRGEYALSDAFGCACELFRAITAIEITTTSHFLALSAARVADRENQLQAFNRAVSHEIKNRIGMIVNAGDTLLDSEGLRERDQRMAAIVARNAHEMKTTLDNLLVLARLDDRRMMHRVAPLQTLVEKTLNAVRASARAAGVELDVDGPLPDVMVDQRVVELSLKNYLCNAIKYADPNTPHRYVHVRGNLESSADGADVAVIHVVDNGVGVPAEKRAQLFERFFRAHAGTGRPGTGLGLSIVRASVGSVGGHAWAEFPAKGSIFSFAVPITTETRGQRSEVGENLAKK